MPFQSVKQRSWMYANRPDIAKRWAKEHPNQGRLPMRAKKDKRSELISAFMKRKPPGPPSFPSPHGQATTKPGKLSGGNRPTEDYPYARGRGGNKITEDSPSWNPRTMGNKRGNSTGYYRKGRGRPD